MFNKILRTVKYLSPILICSILISCGASAHFGKTSIVKPHLDDKDENAWFLYYQDQFDGKGGIVEIPDGSYSSIAHEAFQKADLEWKKKVEHKNNQNAVALVFVSCVVLVLGFVNMGSNMEKGWKK